MYVRADNADNVNVYSRLLITRNARLLTLLVYLVAGVALAWLMRDIRFDDPFITYRYAENLAAGHGFVFNPGERVLITTAPLYALILALARVAGADIPATSFVIGTASLIIAAWALFLLGNRHGRAWVSFVAGLFLLLFPLVWLTLGFETPLFLAVALLTFLAVDARKTWLAGIGAGVAIGLRGDGLIVLAVAALFQLAIGREAWGWGLEIKKWRGNLHAPRPISTVLAALLVYAPLALWLALQFGSPLPTTLQTKSAQAVSGLTGFYPFTSFIEGAGLVVQALLAQSAGLIVLLLLAMFGTVYAVRRWHCLGGLRMPLVWAAAHLVGYSVLGVAPYVWYYAPVVPGFVCLTALGIVAVGQWMQKRVRLRAVTMSGIAAWVVLSLGIAVMPIVAVLQGAMPPLPSDLRAKLLPETKVDIYQRVGEWLRTHTSADASVGVTELGVMSYYAQRHTVDFLGLTQPQYLAAIRHGDYLQALLREQPDYVALTSVNAMYDFDPQRTSWFTALYSPAQVFEDARFWGSPITVWQRTGEMVKIVMTLDEGAHDLGDGWQLTRIVASSREVVDSEPLFLRLRLRAGKPVGTRTLRVQPVLLEGGDGLPVSSRMVFTDQWREGEQDWVDVPIMPQPAPPKGGYMIEASWLEGGPVVRAGTLKVSLDEPARPDVPLAPLSQGLSVERFTQPLTFCIGATQPMTLYWRAGEPLQVDYTAFVHLRNDARLDPVAQADAPPRNGTYPTSVWSRGEVIPDPHTFNIGADVLPGEYTLVVGLYNPLDNTRLNVEPSPYRTADGGVEIGRVVVQACK